MSTINTAYNSITDSTCALTVLAIEKVNSNTEVLKPIGSWQALTSPLNKGTFTLNLDPNKGRPTTVDSFRKIYTKDIKPICDQDTEADDACANPTFGSGDDVAGNYVFAQHLIDLSIKPCPSQILFFISVFLSIDINSPFFSSTKSTSCCCFVLL